MINLSGTPNKGQIRRQCHSRRLSCSCQGHRRREANSTLCSHFRPLQFHEAICAPCPFHERSRGSHTGQALGLPGIPGRGFCCTIFLETLRQGAEVYQKLKSLAKKKYSQLAGDVGDEGDVAPNIQIAEEALKLITKTIKSTSYTSKVYIAIHVASSKLYKEDAKNTILTLRTRIAT